MSNPTPQPAEQEEPIKCGFLASADAQSKLELVTQLAKVGNPHLTRNNRIVVDWLAVIDYLTPKAVPADGELREKLEKQIAEIMDKLVAEVAWACNTCQDDTVLTEVEDEAKTAIFALFAAQAAAAQERAVFDAQTNAVAWAVGVLDDLHTNHTLATTLASNEDDKIYKGIKNTLRDRYKAEAGIDPAPNYPVKANLAAHPKQQDGGEG